MKQFISLFAILFLCFANFSCDKEKDFLEISKTSINFKSEESSQTFNVISNISWSVSCNSEWCDISSYYGTGNRALKITVSKNTSTSSRSAIISISGGSKPSCTIDIYQAGSTSNDEGGNTTISSPSGVKATKDGDQVYITWNSVSGASSYKVYRSSSSAGSYSSIGATTSTYKYDTSPLKGYNYYKITALTNSGVESTKSNSASCNHTSGGGETETKPNAPTGVTTTYTGSSIIPEIRVSWNSVSGATSYKVYRCNSANGSYVQIGNTTSSTFLNDLSPRTGNNYYKVKAINSAGESPYSDYALYYYDSSSLVSPCPVTYGNCTVSGTQITMRWTAPTTSGCGKPTKAYLRVRNPISGVYADIETLPGTATSASFNYGMWIDSNGYVYVGIITENDKGTSGGVPKVYDTKNKKWI